MRQKNVASIIILSFLIWLLFASRTPFSIIAKAQPQGIVIGVKKGDWIRYGNISATWDSAVMKPDPDHIDLNNTLWFMNEVLDIIDAVIVFRQTTQFKNNTQKSSVFQLDVYSGDGNEPYMYISSGLRPNDMLYPGSDSPLWINDTTPRMYAGAIREANYLNLTIAQLTDAVPPAILQVFISYHWDRETGVLTARSGAGVFIDQDGVPIAYWTRSEEIVETNLWSPDEPPSDGSAGGDNESLYLIVGVAASTVIAIVLWLLWPRRRRLKTRRSRKRR